MQERKRRSDCPISCALDVLGDRWSLLIVRDILLRGKTTHGAFRESSERIATNILGDRLTYLEQQGIVSKRPNPDDGRSEIFALTEKGADLLPLLIAMTEWSGKHDETFLASKQMRDEMNAFVETMKHLRRHLMMAERDQSDKPVPAP
ncbi:MAG: helix-turn-helix domain-containing protein [Xanthobacteraceae bacterium]